MNKKILPILIIVGVMLSVAFVIASCLSFYRIRTPEPARSVGSKLSLDLSRATLLSEYDSHDDFLGDGTSYYALRFEDDEIVNQIKNAQGWRALPMNTATTTLIFGRGGDGSYIIGEDNKPLIPNITHGYYFFYDKQNTNHWDDSQVLSSSRYSQNFYVGIYDLDTHTLYYGACDS